jgi:hypothetical protein
MMIVTRARHQLPSVARLPVWYAGMHGLGDNIYQRAHIRQAVANGSEIYLTTPWPQLYADLPGVRCVKPNSHLRTQAKNEKGVKVWSPRPAQAHQRRVEYQLTTMRGRSIFDAMGAAFPGGAPRPATLDLPPEPLADVTTGALATILASERPLAVVRPPTVRKEWTNESRNCLPEYVGQIARALMRTHAVISLADLEPGAEWLVGNLSPPAHMHLHAGELTTMEAVELCRRVAVVVGPVGFIAPLGIATGVPTFIVLGGQGAQNGPAAIQPDWLGPGRLGFAMPDRFCQCQAMRHTCDKTISDPVGQFRAWAKDVGVET